MTVGRGDRPEVCLKLGRVTVDLGAERVFDASGQPCALRPQAFAVLRHLVANPGRLVTKDELMEAVWPGLAVTDDSLVQCIGEIRRALGDSKGLIETLPRRGYRLVLPPEAAGVAPGLRRWAGAGLAAAALVLAVLGVGALRMLTGLEEASRTPSIAVLPFVSMAGETGDYLGPGVADDVISMLARSPDMAVVARRSSFAYGGGEKDVREIGKALGVDYVLEGSVRREGDKLRITAELVDAESGRHVWADRFDRAGTDPWALVDEVTGKIVNAMVGERGEVKRAQFREAWGKDSGGLGEYDYFLRGLDVYTAAETPEENDRGGAIWAEGLARYPDSALLKVKLGWYHWTAAWYFWSGDLPAHFREAGRLVTETLATDNLSPETRRAAHWLNAYVLMQQGEFDDAVREAELTVEMAPYDARVLRSLTDVLVAAGHYQTALDWLADGEPREPGAAWKYMRSRADIYRLMGRYEDSVQAYGTVENKGSFNHLSLAISLVNLGRMDEARAEVRAALELDPQFTLALWRDGVFYADPAVVEGEVAALTRAGLPEG